VLPLTWAVYATNAAHPELGTRTPADVGLEFEDVTITSGDGTRLAAWYIPSGNGSVVLVRHGSGSTRTSVLDHAAFLAKSGYGVLLTDARGHGESGGRINEWGWHGPADIDAALDFIQSRPDFTGSIGVLGLSMGGEEALNAAATDNRISGVAADGAGVSSYNDSVTPSAHLLARSVNWIQFQSARLLTDVRQPAGVATSMPQIAPRPVLLIAGADPVERKMGPIYKEKGGSTTELWKLTDTPHTGGLKKHDVAYRERVLGFFDRALLNK
jgi:pimeloyl-ACP methyl ester carboxylesterase